MIAAGPGYLGYGASLLWTGPQKDVRSAVRDHGDAGRCGGAAQQRSAGDRAGDRAAAGEGQIVCALPERVGVGAGGDAGAAGSGGAAAFQFLFAGLPENVEYYVAAGPLVSPHYKVRVVDLPSVKEIQVTYHYPKWTGMQPVTEEHSRRSARD